VVLVSAGTARDSIVISQGGPPSQPVMATVRTSIMIVSYVFADRGRRLNENAARYRRRIRFHFGFGIDLHPFCADELLESKGVYGVQYESSVSLTIFARVLSMRLQSLWQYGSKRGTRG
jgi:hypothetical protein